ncbi:MAG: endolytic transglycosylase MltG, partial [Alphaproteobacteria bacterium]
MTKRILFAFMLIIFTACAFGYQHINAAWNSTSTGLNISHKTILIPQGASLNQITDILYERGVLGRPIIFKFMLYVNNDETRLKAGEYRFDPNMTMKQVAGKLIAGDVIIHRLTIPEGKRTGEVLDIISDTPALSGALPLKFFKEGDFLPETYFYRHQDSREQLLNRMQKAQISFLEKVWQNRNRNISLETSQQAIILASIIEAEADSEAEHGLISGVFHNRLARGMRLQSDPTVIYALEDHSGVINRVLSRQDLRVDSPYNTYRNKGLPPGPINNPGKAAIKAAVNPLETDYLYFVATGEGGHY